MLDIYSPGDDLYGVFESKTILKISEILNVKAKTPFEKKFEEANKKLAKINENNKEDIPSNLPKGDNLPFSYNLYQYNQTTMNYNIH